MSRFSLPSPPTPLSPDSLKQMGWDPRQVGIVIVDHGSRRDESNQLLLEVVDAFRQATGLPIVEAAHMELAEPSIATAFARAVQQGARCVIGNPYFLSPGRHWRRDIPELFRQAAEDYPSVQYLVTAPLGLHPLMQQIMQDRIVGCLRHALAENGRCDVCEYEPEGCQFRHC